MKKGDKFIILLLLLIILLVAAAIGYRFLSEQYTPQEIPITIVENGNITQTENTKVGNVPAENTPTSDADAATSSKVPDFTVYDMDGDAVSLYDCLGKPVVLNFWATWCGPCQSEMPAFDNMYQKYGNQVTFLMVNVTDGSRDTAESVTTFYEDSGYTFPIYLDTTLEASMTYGAYSIPVTFFIDPKGNLLYNHMGAISEDALAQCMELLVQTTDEPVTK